MPGVKIERALSEPQFAALVDALAADPSRREELTDLLREAHRLYAERSSAAIVRMRGWVLLALAHAEVSDAALIFLLEELDTGVDPYLVAAAARALRSYQRPTEALAPFVMRALANIRIRDEPISFESYGEYATSDTGTSPVRELLATLAWLGPHARGVLPELEALRAQRGALSRKARLDLDRAIQAIRGADRPEGTGTHACCALPDAVANTSCRAPESRHGSDPAAAIVLQDHTGALVTFKEVFQGQPSIVVFFYTRCDNPMKCSLTVAKLGRVQKLLEAQGLAERIRTAAITYDPEFDLPARLRVYAKDRDVRMDARHRMLRAVEGNDVLRQYFALGVNYVESLVNRHRIEVYVLDAQGRIAVSFERIHWDEQEVVDRAVAVMNENGGSSPTGQMSADRRDTAQSAGP